MKIDIKFMNWEKYNPPTDKKSFWCRLDPDLIHNTELMECSYNARWLFIALLCRAARSKGEAKISPTWIYQHTKMRQHQAIKHLSAWQDAGMIEYKIFKNVEKTPYGRTDGRTERTERTDTDDGPDGTIDTPEKPKRQKRPKTKLEIVLPEDCKELAKSWFDYATAECPNADFNLSGFEKAVSDVCKKRGLTTQQLAAIFDFIRQDDFWQKNAISPVGLMKQGSNGLKKIDNILTKFKAKHFKHAEVLAWAQNEDQKPVDPFNYEGGA